MSVFVKTQVEKASLKVKGSAQVYHFPKHHSAADKAGDAHIVVRGREERLQ